jgi:hypothetical protein
VGTVDLLKLLLLLLVVDYYCSEPLTLGAGPLPPVNRKAWMGGRQSPRAFSVLYTLGLSRAAAASCPGELPQVLHKGLGSVHIQLNLGQKSFGTKIIFDFD